MKNVYPKVSIIIPVYNGSNYLHAAIESALGQTYPNIEILVVNDGSTDAGKTREVALKYDEYIRYFEKENGGVSSALNFGIRQMTGEYFSWLSHDDLYYPTKIERQIEFFQNTPGCKVVASSFDIIDADEHPIKTYTHEGLIHNGWTVLRRWVNGCTLLIHKTVFEDVGYFNERNRTTQDIEMWLKLVYHNYSISFLPEPLSILRNHEERGSKRLRVQQIQDLNYLFHQILRIYPITFFASEPLDGNTLSKEQCASLYTWLGDNAKKRGALTSAKTCYRYALATSLSPFNPAWKKYLLVFYDSLKSIR